VVERGTKIRLSANRPGTKGYRKGAELHTTNKGSKYKILPETSIRSAVLVKRGVADPYFPERGPIRRGIGGRAPISEGDPIRIRLGERGQDGEVVS